MVTVHDVGAPDYYQVLGVDRDATKEQIKDAFRDLALKYHPDRSTEPDAEERFKEIAAAYAVLSDAERRATYDRGGFAGVSAEDLFSATNLGDLFADMGFGADLGGGLFETLFGRSRRRGPRPGRDIETAVTVSLDEVATGTARTVSLPHQVVCDVCSGSGAASGTEPRACEHCSGSGQMVKERDEENVFIRQIEACSHCEGQGTIIDTPCSGCSGTGQQETARMLEITIPVGIESGTALRVAGHGEASPEPGGRPGDAYVLVRVAPDPRFDRRGPHLWRTETIDVADAVLGTELITPTLDGTVKVSVPPGTQPGSVLRLAGKGMPPSGPHQSGDLYIAIVVQVPTSLGPEQRRLYEELRAQTSRHDT